MTDHELDPRFIAAYDMLRRTGAHTIQMRYQDDQEPVVWFCVAFYATHDGHPVPHGTEGADERYQLGVGLNPVRAVLNACENAVDGSFCKHCGRPAAFLEEFGPNIVEALTCAYKWDPELATFRRSCEGVASKDQPGTAPGT